MALNKDKVRAAAQKYLQKGQIAKAIREYQRLVKEDPKDIRTYLKIGDLYTRAGKSEDAIATYEHVAEFYSEQGFFLKSVAVYKQILKVKPDILSINQKLADLYNQLGLVQDAALQYEAICQIYEQQEQLSEATAVLTKLIDLDPENIAAKIKLADLQARRGDVVGAVQELRKVASSLKSQNRTADYAKVAERIATLDPQDTEVTRELADFYIQKGDARRALAKLQVCFERNPRDIPTLVLLGTAFKELGQAAKTVSVYRELSNIYAEQGNDAERHVVLRQICELEPNAPEARELQDLTQEDSTPEPAPGAPEISLELESASSEDAGSAGPANQLGRITPAQRAVETPQAAVKEVNSTVHEDASGAPAEERVTQLTDDFEVVEVAPFDDSVGPADPEFDQVLTEALVYVKYGLKDKAAAHYASVFEKRPEHAEARRRHKELMVELGQIEAAVEDLWVLAQAERRQGNIDNTRELLEELLELDSDFDEGRSLLAKIDPKRAEELKKGAFDDLVVEEEKSEVVRTRSIDYEPADQESDGEQDEDLITVEFDDSDELEPAAEESTQPSSSDSGYDVEIELSADLVGDAFSEGASPDGADAEGDDLVIEAPEVEPALSIETEATQGGLSAAVAASTQVAAALDFDASRVVDDQDGDVAVELNPIDLGPASGADTGKTNVNLTMPDFTAPSLSSPGEVDDEESPDGIRTVNLSVGMEELEPESAESGNDTIGDDATIGDAALDDDELAAEPEDELEPLELDSGLEDELAPEPESGAEGMGDSVPALDLEALGALDEETDASEDSQEVPTLDLDALVDGRDLVAEEFSSDDLAASSDELEAEEFSSGDLAASSDELAAEEFSSGDLTASSDELEAEEFSSSDLAASSDELAAEEFSTGDLSVTSGELTEEESSSDELAAFSDELEAEGFSSGELAALSDEPVLEEVSSVDLAGSTEDASAEERVSDVSTVAVSPSEFEDSAGELSTDIDDAAVADPSMGQDATTAADEDAAAAPERDASIADFDAELADLLASAVPGRRKKSEGKKAKTRRAAEPTAAATQPNPKPAEPVAPEVSSAAMDEEAEPEPVFLSHEDIDFAAEISQELRAAAEEEVDDAASFENVFADFKRGVEATVEATDYQTHYDLGIAYKEMGLTDDAIREFGMAQQSPAKELEALTMIGLCELEAGRTQAALGTFQRGLSSNGVTPDVAVALRYEIGAAYESMGRLADAMKFYEKACSLDAGFRDVSERVNLVQQRLNGAAEEASDELDSLLQDSPADRVSRASKISYL